MPAGRSGRRDGTGPSFRPTARGAVVAAVAACGWAVLAAWPSRGRVLAPLAAAATTALLAGALATCRARSRCRLVVTAHPVPAVAEVGSEAVLRVTVTNRGPTRCSGAALTLGVDGPWAPSRPVVRVAALARGATETVDLPLSTARRGRRAGGSGRLWALDALVTTGTVLAAVPSWSFVVVPAAVPPAAGPLPAETPSSRHAAGSDAPTGEDGTGELAGLRPYRPGDRLHRLHWPSLAPGRTPLVRCFGDDLPPERVAVVLDDRSGVHRRDGFERALAACLGVVDACDEHGVDVDVRTFTGRSLPAPVGRRGRVDLAAELAVLEPAPTAAPPWPTGAPPAPVVVTSATGADRLGGLLPPGTTVVVAG